ncbi:hypothetical protein CC86DRAFT_283311, partial [Ophiobolus disseminans]
CYKSPASDGPDCTFSKNDCICADELANTVVAGCIFTQCSMRDWLAAKNATSMVCERPIRDRTHVLAYSATICSSFWLR